jgi:PAS domain S-box-containing protein
MPQEENIAVQDRGRNSAQGPTDPKPAPSLEEKYQRSRDRLRLLFDEVPCYISVQDPNLQIIHANRKFREAFGDHVGAYCYQVYKHRDEPCINCSVEKTFQDGASHTSEEVVTCLSGDRINTLVQTAPLLNDEGEIDLVIEMSTNITQIRKLQGQLTNLGLLVGSISHGLKGLLTGLDGGMYLLNTGLDKDKPERVSKGRGMVKRNVENIRQVVLDLLSIAGEDEPQFKPVDLHELGCAVEGRLSKWASDLELDFQTDFATEATICEIDEKSMQESLINILKSAFESCRVDTKKKHHFVRFSLTACGDNATFEIEDNGIGMDQETREKMFSLFFASKGTEATGLGLFTANKVIEKHRGTIEVESEPGQGTTYSIRIPKVRA